METQHVIASQLSSAIANARRYEDVLREARTDPLTGLGSRRMFEDTFRRELASSRRRGAPLTLAMLDLDGLKAINDGWGHAMGDEVLRAVGDLLRRGRASDVSARLGGDEFLILMPDTNVEEGQTVIRRLREGLRELNASGRFPFPVELSAGLRQLGAAGVDDLLAEADAAMYREKQGRREGGPTPAVRRRDASGSRDPFLSGADPRIQEEIQKIDQQVRRHHEGG
jgi:diguanylate cyclase (GGDEF)-like protein